MKNKLFFILLLLIFGCSPVIQEQNIKYIDFNKKNITLKDKIAQMIMIRMDGKFHNKDHWMKNYIQSLIIDYKIGGLITFAGSVHGTYYNLKYFQELSEIPLFIAADYERGLGTFINGTLFPPNMAIAATGDINNAAIQGEIIAKEARALGVNMILAPVVDINNNINNPIINIRSYGDNPEIVTQYSIPFINAVQKEGLLSCVKHYPGHGNTSTDSHTSLPIININQNELYDNELYPFHQACKNGVKAVMVGHILIPSIDSSPSTFSNKITRKILREDWNFNGLIITDALEMGALTSTTWHGESVIKAIEAGADILLLPIDGIKAINSVYDAVINGRISEERINESFQRIITQKNIMNSKDIFSNSWEELEYTINKKEHLNRALDIAQKSITLVKNENNIVPFIPYKYKKVSHVLISTDNDLRIRLKSFVKDINYIHGNVKEIYVNDSLSNLAIEDVIDKLKNSDLIIISMLIRISMDKGKATIDATHNQLLAEIKKLKIPMLGISFGSPYLPDYNHLDAYLCSYGYGNVSLSATTNALFGRKDIEGHLPITLNNQYIAGHGIIVKKKDNEFNQTFNIELKEPISIIEKAIEDNIFPGAQLFISKDDDILINNGYGKLTYDVESPSVTINTIYDVASITKVLAATPIIMKLLQKKRIGLNFPLSDFYPEFNKNLKKDVTIRHLLTHTSGIKSYIEYYKKPGFDSKEKIVEDIINQKLEYKPDSEVVYSDLGIILLTDIIEKITKNSLDILADLYLYKPLNMKNTFYNPPQYLKNTIAPTENDNYFRNRLLQGEVHDENAYLMGGVSGHAGIFSTASDIGKYAKMLNNGGVYLGKRYLKKNIINQFTNKINIPENSDRTIGWDTPSNNGKSSAGDYFSNKTYGHLGFTGTSLWIDPENNIIVVLLTNRVNPSRNTKGIYKVRREFHNALIKILGDK